MFVLEEKTTEFKATYKTEDIIIKSKTPLNIIYGTLMVGVDVLFYGYCKKFDITVFATSINTARVLINMTLVKLWVDYFKTNVESGTTLFMTKKEKLLFETFTWNDE